MDEAEIYKDGSDGSAEKLLGEPNPEQTEETGELSDNDGDDDDDDDEEEDDDIAKLMGFDDNDSANEQKEKKSKRIKSSVFKSSATASLLEDTDGLSLKVVRIESIPEQINITPYPPSRKPLADSILKRQRKMEKMYAKHNSQTSKMVCGVLCMFVIMGIGAALLFFAITLGMKDLYIIGGIFAGGGILFTLSFIILRCNEQKMTSNTNYSTLFKSTVD